MRESVGKSVVRRILYEEILPTRLSHESLVGGNTLILLGKEPRELPYLDNLGVPRSRVWSIERESDVYRKQLKLRSGVHLNFGEVGDFLQNMLSSNQEFIFSNLDIEGSYLSQLDGAMTPILLLCLRKPETLVGTYSSIGRDTEMLWEGIKSLAIFLWWSKDLTLQVFASLSARYKSAGFTQPANMVLRDFFWLRSMLEHALITSCIVDVAPQKLVYRWFAQVDMLWKSVARWRRKPLSLEAMIKSVELATMDDVGKKEVIVKTPPCLASQLNSLTHIIYHAERPWSQRCYFSKFKVTEAVIDCNEWLDKGLQLFLSEPLIFVDRDGTRREFSERAMPHDSLQEVLCDDLDLYRKFKPRVLPIYQPSKRLLRVTQTSLAAVGIPTYLTGKENGMSKQFCDKNGKVTEYGKSEIQSLSAKFTNLSVDQIIELLPRGAQKIPKRVIAAHVAVGRRKK